MRFLCGVGVCNSRSPSGMTTRKTNNATASESDCNDDSDCSGNRYTEVDWFGELSAEGVSGGGGGDELSQGGGGVASKPAGGESACSCAGGGGGGAVV